MPDLVYRVLAPFEEPALVISCFDESLHYVNPAGLAVRPDLPEGVSHLPPAQEGAPMDHIMETLGMRWRDTLMYRVVKGDAERVDEYLEPLSRWSFTTRLPDVRDMEPLVLTTLHTAGREMADLQHQRIIGTVGLARGIQDGRRNAEIAVQFAHASFQQWQHMASMLEQITSQLGVHELGAKDKADARH